MSYSDLARNLDTYNDWHTRDDDDHHELCRTMCIYADVPLDGDDTCLEGHYDHDECNCADLFASDAESAAEAEAERYADLFDDRQIDGF